MPAVLVELVAFPAPDTVVPSTAVDLAEPVLLTRPVVEAARQLELVLMAIPVTTRMGLTVLVLVGLLRLVAVLVVWVVMRRIPARLDHFQVVVAVAMEMALTYLNQVLVPMARST